VFIEEAQGDNPGLYEQRPGPAEYHILHFGPHVYGQETKVSIPRAKRFTEYPLKQHIFEGGLCSQSRHNSSSPMRNTDGDLKIKFRIGPRAVIPRSQTKFDVRHMHPAVSKHLFK